MHFIFITLIFQMVWFLMLLLPAPQPYNGKAKTCLWFLNHCFIQFKLCAAYFPSVCTKIAYIFLAQLLPLWEYGNSVVSLLWFFCWPSRKFIRSQVIFPLQPSLCWTWDKDPPLSVNMLSHFSPWLQVYLGMTKPCQLPSERDWQLIDELDGHKIPSFLGDIFSSYSDGSFFQRKF